MNAHKFKHNDTTVLYTQVIYCEYCGLVVFYANQVVATNEARYEIARKGCPTAPESTSDSPTTIEPSSIPPTAPLPIQADPKSRGEV